MRNRKILIIHDDTKSFGALEEILVKSGHDLIVVRDALLAVDVVLKNKPDVILLDLKMPRKNGFELADEINYALEAKEVPIIAMSSFFKEEFKLLFNLCGIRGHLRKPYNPRDVLWAIENVAEKGFI